MYGISTRLSAVLAATLITATATATHASTIVEMRFNLGLSSAPFDTVYIELFDDTPNTRDNFLNYVNDGDFTDILMHRLVPGFVLQGGGFDLDLDPIATDAPVVNEFGRTNARGTIAMAKVGGDPDSATSQFFFNLSDNAGTAPDGLDYQNGGFTVFARVLGNGMTLIDALAGLPTINLGSPFGQLPVLPDDGGNIPLFMESVSVYELRIGDTDLDGDVDQDDADLLNTTLVGGTDEPQFDVDRNGSFDQSDLDTLNTLLTGDVNGDGFVGVDDLNMILSTWNQSVPPADSALDRNNDGFIGVDDLNAVLTAWNLGTPPATPAATVPEPASLCLLGLGGLAMLKRRR